MPENPFANPDPARVFLKTPLITGLWDAFPVSPGHALLIPNRVVPTWFDATPEEQQALTRAITTTKEIIEQHHKPDGYNIGINAGAAAGQTVFHLHVHVIPRYEGDVEDPRGGVRHVIPSKANYLVKEAQNPLYGSQSKLVTGGEDPLLPHLLQDLARAQRADLAVSFLQPSGLNAVIRELEDLLLQRHGQCRLVTGDYLDITHPDALERLLNLAHTPHAHLQLRVFQSARAQRGFHPKAYLFIDARGGKTAYVGSSNLSHSALTDSVEWNYRFTEARGTAGVQQSFEQLFHHPHTTDLTYEWLAAYRKRRKPLPTREPIELLDDEPLPPATPHPIQQEALRALEETRRLGNGAGLVVMATGLGKTWLAAFDSVRFDRVLFVAHREEILNQSMNTFRRIRPEATFGFYTGTEKTGDADILFASVQTLGKARHLEAFAPDDFDYIVIDEFHHAAAPTYQRVIDHFSPRFLLGLTATPERTDGGNLLALCGQNLVYRCDLAEGMRENLLCPLHYYGVPDEVDYSNIPWRNARFNEEELTRALSTIKRAENAIEQYHRRAGKRTVAFCSTKAHADFMADQFQQHGINAAAVHSGPTTASRADSLKRLERGELQVICCVDMFNEGLDLPQVDTVMMLRPTESRIVWLQQLGRGLRKADGKSHLTVIDYIGNHRTFRIKLETLVLELLRGNGRSDAELRKALRGIQYEEVELPPGCEVTYDLAAVEILESLLRSPRKDEALRAFYEEFLELNAERPKAVEAYQGGVNPRVARQGFGSWLGFVHDMGGLTTAEEEVWKANQRWFESLEKTPMVKSYKMVVLQALLAAGQFPGEIGIQELVRGFRRMAERSARLRSDVGAHLGSDEQLLRMLEKNPIPAWCDGKGTGGRAYFEYHDGVFRSVGFEGDEAAVGRLTRELMEWRLADYLDRAPVEDEPILRVKVNNNGTNPILFPLNREKQPGLPTGEVEVMVEGEKFLFRFVKVAVNVATKPGEKGNVLPEILKRLFGETAGAAGTNHYVAFEQIGDVWRLTRA